jgi:hypothetical protein
MASLLLLLTQSVLSRVVLKFPDVTAFDGTCLFWRPAWLCVPDLPTLSVLRVGNVRDNQALFVQLYCC